MIDDLTVGISLTVFATLIGSAGALFFKYTSATINKKFIDLLKNHYLYLGFLLYGVSSLIFVFSLKFGDLSTLYPIAGLSYVWISLLSIKFLKEKMNDLKWFGVIMIILGVILISFGA